jgi:hypothetical protein
MHAATRSVHDINPCYSLSVLAAVARFPAKKAQ